MAIVYEWIVEELDGVGDDAEILDTHAFDNIHEVLEYGRACDGPVRYGLTRDVGNDVDGLTDRQWAYIENGQIPERFDGGAKVPVTKRGLVAIWWGDA